MIKATIQGGRIEIDVPSDWPDGTQVEIYPLGNSTPRDTGEMSPEEIKKTLAAMDQVKPFDFTEDEWVAWEAERQARKERDKAQFVEHADELRRAWE